MWWLTVSQSCQAGPHCCGLDSLFTPGKSEMNIETDTLKQFGMSSQIIRGSLVYSLMGVGSLLRFTGLR